MTNRGPQCYKTSSYLLRVLASRFRSMSRKAATVGDDRWQRPAARATHTRDEGPSALDGPNTAWFRLIPAAQLRNLDLTVTPPDANSARVHLSQFRALASSLHPQKALMKHRPQIESVTNPSGCREPVRCFRGLVLGASAIRHFFLPQRFFTSSLSQSHLRRFGSGRKRRRLFNHRSRVTKL